MSISVKLYTFAKEPNSTALPSGSGTNFDCVLIDNTSVMNPQIKLILNINPSIYNYAYIADFGRYYFISDWSADAGRWIATMSCDVLASFKSSITSSTQYVARSASEFDEYLSDTLYPTTTDISIQSASVIGSSCYPTPSSITFIVGIISQVSGIPTAQQGSVVYYAMTGAQISSLLTFLNTNYTDWTLIPALDMSEGYQRALINPFQYITSVKAVPFDATALGTLVTGGIYFGPYRYPAFSGYALERNDLYTEQLTFTCIKHPQDTDRAYLNSSPYTAIKLRYGPFGEIPLDPMDYIDDSTILVTQVIDAISGDATLYIQGSTTGRITSRSANVGVEVSVSALQQNQMEYGAEVLGAKGNTADIMGLMNIGNYGSKLLSSINDAAKSKFGTTEVKGTQGSYAGWRSTPMLIYTFFKCVEFDDAHNGRCLMQKKTLSTLSGFTLVMNPDVKISGTFDEAEKIRDFMSNGFYLE